MVSRSWSSRGEGYYLGVLIGYWMERVVRAEFWSLSGQTYVKSLWNATICFESQAARLVPTALTSFAPWSTPPPRHTMQRPLHPRMLFCPHPSGFSIQPVVRGLLAIGKPVCREVIHISNSHPPKPLHLLYPFNAPQLAESFVFALM